MIVSSAAVENREADAEPISMMVSASAKALRSIGNVLDSEIDAVHVVKGIWPYTNPGRLVADRLPASVLSRSPTISSALTRMGGNAPYDLVSHTAEAIAAGEFRAAIVCGAETMRTRRSDKAAGRKSPYLPETDDGEGPDIIGDDIALSDDVDAAARVDHPVHFYAMVENRLRQQRRESYESHVGRIAAMWAEASEIAADNPSAWIQTPTDAPMIATASESNRLVSSPYTKLLTSNINVDQGAALVMTSYRRAQAAGLADGEMVFVCSGASAHDVPTIRARERLDRSPAIRAVGAAALRTAGRGIADIDRFDLYSCFPAAIQVARFELGITDDQPFTMTGGMTFAGGPFNGYGTQAIARVCELVRGTTMTAMLTGNGGYFTKHSALVLSGDTPHSPFAYARPQSELDGEPTRPIVAPGESLTEATIETYTVPFDRDGVPAAAIVSAIDARGRRVWTLADDPADIARLLVGEDLFGHPITLYPPVTDDDRSVTGKLT